MIHTDKRPSLYTEQPAYGDLTPFQRECLRWLASVLQNKDWYFDKLAEKLSQFLEHDNNEQDRDTSRHHMCQMAEEVVEAIPSRRPLHIARLVDSVQASAIFVGVQEATSNNFTSWHHKRVSHGRIQDFCVSLSVNVHLDYEIPTLRTLEWINGLAFLKQAERIAVAFGWPRAWM